MQEIDEETIKRSKIIFDTELALESGFYRKNIIYFYLKK